MTHASVFSGIGGPEVAAAMLGWENLFHCEINPFGRAVLDYWYPNAKSYDDITKTDFTEWRGRVDVLTGGFPCQPFSYAGQRRGAEDDRYLWPYMFKCIDTIRPTWVVAENVGGILTMVEQGEVSGVETQGALFGEEDVVRRYELRETFTLERICRDLETHGYAVQPVLVPACAVGAPHRRDRVFIVGRRRDDATDTSSEQCDGLSRTAGKERQVCDEPEHGPLVPGEGGRQDVHADTCGFGEYRQVAETYAAADAVGGGEGTTGEGGSVEGDGSDQDKQPCQRGAATEWNSRFYELLRNAADTADHGLQHGTFARSEGSETGTLQGQRHSAERNVPTAANGDRGTVTDTDSEGRGRRSAPNGRGCATDGGQDLSAVQREFERHHDYEVGERWANFPTVSPVHRGNDGLPFPLDDLTLSPAKWRTEALKAYGNAIVPQVMYEIFRAIEIAEKRNT